MIGSETGAEGEGKAAGRERQKGQEAERSAAAAAAIYCSAKRCHSCYHCIEALVRLVVCGRSETPSTF